jgi:hypothetical protein
MSRMSETMCARCRGRFLQREAVLAEGGGRFCSPKCSGEARSARIQETYVERLEARFFSRVEIFGPTLMPRLGRCHVWLGARDHHGYGQLRIVDSESMRDGRRGRLVKAHRVGFLLHYGRWPEVHALHSCDGGPIGCVRWEHLFEGDHAANMADMNAKGRHGSKLTREQVEFARERLRKGCSQASLARELGVGTAQMSRIANGTSWRPR